MDVRGLLLAALVLLTPLSRASDYAALESSALSEGAVWVVDAAAPGPGAPPVGRSLFDHLFTVVRDGEPRYAVPFPFAALLARIESELAPLDTGAVKQVLIPLGRSLHREAAAPEYFRYPRVVIAVNGEPIHRAGEAGILLKERLFLGYQEKADVIEVISYNEDAGRFEFQVVHNYAAGLEPRVNYASRALCMSCHQNGGPIFPKVPWRETDANLDVAVLIEAASPGRLVKPLYRPKYFIPWGIDYATDQANYFASYQLLWRQGCGAGEQASVTKAVRCRGAVLTAALKYRLTGSGYIDDHLSYYQNDFLDVVASNWSRLWPAGLLVPTADLADRDPLALVGSVELDPIRPRPLRAIWPQPAPQILVGAVEQLSEFLSEADIRRLDQFLYRRAVAAGAPRRRYEATCRFSRDIGEPESKLIHFDCVGKGFNTSGRLHLGDNGGLRGGIDRLTTRDFPELRFLILEGVHNQTERRIRLRLLGRDANRLPARNRDGNLLERLELQWTGDLEGTARLSVLEDFYPVASAIQSMIQGTLQGRSDALSAKPFRRRAVLRALHRHLGMPALEWCCDERSPMPPLTVDGSTEGVAETALPTDVLAPFYEHCAVCHATTQHQPPGFLHGSPDQALRAASGCAPRILFRLAMWQRAPEQRSTSPMPPLPWLSRLRATESEWRESESLAELRAATLRLLGAGKDVLSLGSILSTDPDSLPECLSGKDYADSGSLASSEPRHRERPR